MHTLYVTLVCGIKVWHGHSMSTFCKHRNLDTLLEVTIFMQHPTISQLYGILISLLFRI